MTPVSGVDVLADALRSARVTAVFGAELDGIAVHITRDEVAAALTTAFSRVMPGERAAQHVGRGTLRFGAGEPTVSVNIRTLEEIHTVVADAANGTGTTDVVFDVDLDHDAGLDVAGGLVSSTPDDTWGLSDDGAIDAIERSERPLGLAGPGVLANGQVASLRQFTLAANLGMLNTWGAKGVLHWQSAHHLATIGLQTEDFRLSGFADADLVVTSALDVRESPPRRWQIGAAEIVDIAPNRLAATAEALRRPHLPIAMPPLRDRLAAVTVEGWNADTSPPMPSGLTRIYAETVAGTGTVFADPGIAGFFAARTTGTARPGGVVVPADGSQQGFAVAAAIVSALVQPWRRVVAAVDDPLPPLIELLIDSARACSLPLVVDVWADDGLRLPAAEHRCRLRGAFLSGGVHVERIATDRSQLDRYLDAAGPIIAWLDRPS